MAAPEVPPAPPTLPRFTTVSWVPYHDDLYERVYKLILHKGLFFNSATAREQPPFKFKTPEELREEVDFTLGENPVGDDKLMEYMEKLVEYSPHRSHPFYLARDTVGLDPYALAGDYAGTIMSTAVLTYLFAPVYTLQEFEVEKQLRRLIGYPNPERGDGVHTPGAGFATSMAFTAAMTWKYPETRNKGYGAMDEPQMAVYASESCNEFVEKAVIVAGLGSEALVKISVDSSGRMNIKELRQKIQRNKSKDIHPLVIIATIGSDPHGGIDSTTEIAQVCQEYNAWFHVDGAYAGALLLSDDYRRSKLAGIEKSQSFLISGTHMLGIPACFTCMVTPIQDQFFKTFGVGAEVVFEPTLLYDSKYDKGDHTLQTSRRGDIAKFWLIWKAKGRNGMAQHLKYIMDLAAQFNEEIKKRSSLHAIISNIDTTRVNFYYVPSHLRMSPRRLDVLNYQMSTMSRKIKGKLLLRGSAYLGLARIRGWPECFSVSVTNSATSLDDLKYVLNEIESAAKDSTVHMSSNPWFPSLPFWKPKPVPLTDKGSRKGSKKNRSDPSTPSTTIAPYLEPPPPRPVYPPYVNAPIESLHKEMFKKIADLFDEKGIYFQDKRSEPILEFRTPESLKTEFDISLRDEGVGENGVMDAIDKIIKYSIHQPHAFYIYQLLSGGLDAYAIMADFAMTSMTSTMLTYEDGPMYTLIEEEVMRASRKRIGYPEDGDGMLLPGGSVCNEVAMEVARLSLFPESKAKGVGIYRQRKLTAYVSANAHYCHKKAALYQGIGHDNVIPINPDANGRMDVEELRRAILETKRQGRTPFYVGATAGTTVLGIFDNVAEISQVCRDNGMWLHVDGSVGGASMFSDYHLQDKLSDIPMSDSFSYNPHKWFGSVQETAILLFKQGGIVHDTLGTPPPNTSSKSRTAGDKDNGMYSDNRAFGDLAAHGGIGWQRRANIFKFWFMWKAKGRGGLGQHIEYTYSNREFLIKELQRPERQPMYRLIKPEFVFQCPGVCFHYIPLSLRGLDTNSEEFKRRVDKVPLPLQARLVRAGVTITPIFRDNGKPPLFTKFTILSSGITQRDIVYLLDAIDFYGRDLPA